MTLPDLDQLERVARAATEGPWVICDEYPSFVMGKSSLPIATALPPNAAFIATFSPALVLQLIEALRGKGQPQ